MVHDPSYVPPPGAVHELAERAVEFVRNSLGLVLDYTPETLPLLDHYLSAVPREQEETVTLIAATAGAYFGEVVRRVLDGEWEQTNDSPTTWNLAIPGGLRIVPTDLADAAIRQTEEAAAYEVPPGDRAAIEEVLTARGTVAEDEYYSLAGRLEVMQLIADVLGARRLTGVSSLAEEPEDDLSSS